MALMPAMEFWVWGQLLPSRMKSAMAAHRLRIEPTVLDALLTLLFRLVWLEVAVGLFVPEARFEASYALWLGYFLIVGLLLGFWRAYWVGYRALRLDRMQRDAEGRLQRKVKREVEAQLGGDSQAEPPEAEPEAPQEVLSALDEKGLRRAERTARFQAATASRSASPYARAVQVGQNHLPGVPRSIVRFVNRVRILMYLGIDRKLFSGPGAVRPDSVGRWAVLVENWPQLAHVLGADPALASELQQAALKDRQDQEGRKVVGGKGNKRSADLAGNRWRQLEGVVGRLASTCRANDAMGAFFLECAQSGWDRDVARIISLEGLPGREQGIEALRPAAPAGVARRAQP